MSCSAEDEDAVKWIDSYLQSDTAARYDDECNGETRGGADTSCCTTASNPNAAS